MTLDGGGGERAGNTRPRDYGRTLFLLREENLRKRECGGGEAAYNKGGVT